MSLPVFDRADARRDQLPAHRGDERQWTGSIHRPVLLDNAEFRFANGTQSLLSDTANWQVSSTGFGVNYVAPADLGADGAAPWGNRISCNNGVPLDQSFDISSTQPVDFVVDLLDFVAPDVECTITLDAVADGYVGSFLANGVDTGEACLFSSEPEVGEAPFDQTAERDNTCAITAEPVSSTFEVEKLWEFEGNDIVGMSADIHIWCAPASTTTGPDFATVHSYVSAFGDQTFTLAFYPDWDGGATCYAEESNLDSAVESDGGCLGGTDFVIGDDPKGCTIVNSVFFEGIPTLSQYGLAVMALLMLGLGFVGFRRFV